jgi:hypothetical protein
MTAQVALTAIGIPVAMESASRFARQDAIRSKFSGRDYLAARIDVDLPFEDDARSAVEARRGRTLAEIERRVRQEPGVIAVAFADRVPGGTRARSQTARIESSQGAWPAFDYEFGMSAVGPGFFEVFDRAIVAGRAFHGGDQMPAARSVVVNEAFVRGFVERGGRGSPIGARLQYFERRDATATQSASAEASADKSFEIVGIVRDIGLDPDDEGHEQEAPVVFHASSEGTIAPLMMHVRMRSSPAPLVARLPVIAADVDASVHVAEVQGLDDWIRQQNDGTRDALLALAGVTMLTLFLSALGMYSLMSVSVSRRTREIGLRAALGAHPRHVLLGILSRAAVLMGSGVVVGAVVVLLAAWLWQEDIAQFVLWLAVTAAVMLGTGLLASLVPARRALRISPIDALKEA